MWEPQRLTTLWAFTACYRDGFTLRHIVRIRLYSDNSRIGGKGHWSEVRWRWRLFLWYDPNRSHVWEILPASCDCNTLQTSWLSRCCQQRHFSFEKCRARGFAIVQSPVSAKWASVHAADIAVPSRWSLGDAACSASHVVIHRHQNAWHVYNIKMATVDLETVASIHIVGNLRKQSIAEIILGMLFC
jgi:hypothetical protein